MDDRSRPQTKKCEVIVWTNYGTEYKTKGELAKANTFLYIESEERLIMYPTIIRDVKGRMKVYVAENNHRGVPKDFLMKLAKGTNLLTKLKYRNPATRKLLTCDVECEGSLDPALANSSKLGSIFSVDASTLMRSKALEFLSDWSDSRMLFTMIGSGAVGFIMGGFVTALWMNGG